MAMGLSHVNLNQLRVFEAVFRLGSMSKAAQELHLTQPGVSQHVGSLERTLGLKLFQRLQQRLVPTAEGKALYLECQDSLQRLESMLVRVKAQKGEVSGELRIGMPVEFGVNRVLPLLGAFGALHPAVKYRVSLDLAPYMNEQLAKGALDFAIVDEFKMDRRITTKRLSVETLELCASRELCGGGVPRGTKPLAVWLRRLPFVDYQEDGALLARWFRHHLGVLHPRVEIRATVTDVQGVARMIHAGLGAGILPGYVADELIDSGAHLVKIRCRTEPLENSLSIAYLREREHAPAAQALMAYLEERLGS
jgi:DNA-binding transcriptional LysR family regulator